MPSLPGHYPMKLSYPVRSLKSGYPLPPHLATQLMLHAGTKGEMEGNIQNGYLFFSLLWSEEGGFLNNKRRQEIDHEKTSVVRYQDGARPEVTAGEAHTSRGWFWDCSWGMVTTL